MSSIPYQIKVSVRTLDEASKLIQWLAKQGYTEVSMEQGTMQSLSKFEIANRSSSALGNFNELIIEALFSANARDKYSSVTIERILVNLRQIKGGNRIFEGRNEGIVSRTVSMVTSSILGDKYGWIGYEGTSPRKYWLTAKGLEHVKMISGHELDKFDG